MRISLLLLLLLPGLAWAQTEKKHGSKLTVKTPKKAEQPAGTYRRVSMQKDKVTFFERGFIGSKKFEAHVSPAPVAFDSAGTMKMIDLTERDAKSPGYESMVKVAHSVFEYDSTGRLLYSKNGSAFSVTPMFNDVEVSFEFETTRLKATYTLNKKAQSRLVWKLVDPQGIAQRKIQAFTAKDADGKIVPVSTVFKSDSLIADVGDGKFPILVDPTVYDTLVVALASDIFATRDATTGTAGAPAWNGSSLGKDNTNYYRSPIAFSLTDLPLPTSVDSVRIYFDPGAETMGAGDSVFMYIVKGTYTGSDIVNDDFNNFEGWAAAGPYTLTEYTAETLWWNNDHVAKSVLFTAAACDSVEVLMSVDTLRLFGISKDDKLGTGYGSASKYLTWGATLPYIAIYYQAGSAPGVSTLADTARAAARLVGEIDSTGGVNCTVRGFKYTLGGADTTTISESGSFTAGTFSLYTAWLWPDSVYYYCSFSDNPNGRGYGTWTSFTAASGTGSTLKVMGRTVNTNVR